MNRIEQPTIIILFGITGDLAQRYSLPALEQINEAGVLPDKFRVIGISRRDISLDEVLKPEYHYLHEHVETRRMNLDYSSDYYHLGERLEEIEAEFGEKAQWLFYLSVPPDSSLPIVKRLGEVGLSNNSNAKLLLEKPFGTDMASAQALIGAISEHFHEEQTYRIDHYMAKEMAQNIIVFRGGNSLIKHTWHGKFIERIDIVSAEAIGIEGRSEFYEQTGALRDVVQSHLLQLAALTLMELPKPGDWRDIPAMRLKALQAIEPPNDMTLQVVRGQYKGYRDEVGKQDSMVETFVSLSLKSNDPTWKDVPITITTGKALNKKTTEIRIRYRQEDASEANELIMHIQPDEGVEVYLWAKRPGFEWELQKLPLEFSYKNHFGKLPQAYERVFVDAMRSDHSLFASSEEVLATWHILDPVQQAWAKAGDDIKFYDQGLTPEDVIKL